MGNSNPLKIVKLSEIFSIWLSSSYNYFRTIVQVMARAGPVPAQSIVSVPSKQTSIEQYQPVLAQVEYNLKPSQKGLNFKIFRTGPNHQVQDYTGQKPAQFDREKWFELWTIRKWSDYYAQRRNYFVHYLSFICQNKGKLFSHEQQNNGTWLEISKISCFPVQE